jgi:hypothetical protein
VGTRVRVGDTEFELEFDLPPGESLPPGVERAEELVEEEEPWPAGVPREMVSYAKELAISSDHAAHWVDFFSTHPHGQLAWKEIQRLWKGTKPRKRRK